MVASRENMLPKLHARDEFYRRWARRSFAEFLLYTKPDYQPVGFMRRSRRVSWINSPITSHRSAVRG